MISRLLLAFIIYPGLAAGFINQAIRVEGLKTPAGVEFRFEINPGFGIQKSAPHALKVYELKPGYEQETNPDLRIARYGREAGIIRTFRGTTAREDAKYWSAVDPRLIPGTFKGAVMIHGPVYFCSFQEKFCSIARISRIID